MTLNNKYKIEFLIVLISVVFLWDTIFLYPIQILITMIHESFHGLAALITGGRIGEITLSGLSGKISTYGGLYPVISVSGYIGTAALGAWLIGTKVNEGFLKVIIIILLGYLLLVSALYLEFSLKFFILVPWVGLIIYFVLRSKYVKDISFMFGLFMSIAALEDVKTYLWSIPSETDAGLLARHLGLELLTLPIAIFMSVISLYFLYLGVRARIIRER